MENQTIVSVIASALAVGATVYSTFTKGQTEKLEQLFKARRDTVNERLQQQQTQLTEAVTIVAEWKSICENLKNDVKEAKAAADRAEAKADCFREHQKDCEIKLAKLEVLLEVNNMLPKDWKNTEK